MSDESRIAVPENGLYGTWTRASRKALVVGINRYRCDQIHNLRGSVNDAEHMAALLESRFDFGVVRLIDEEATRDRALQALQALLDSVERESSDQEGETPAQEVVLFWSGHGSRIHSKRYGFFESLVPHDSYHPNEENECLGPNRDILECEIYAWALRVTRKANLTLLIDACQGGGVVRDIASSPRGVRHERRPDAFSNKVAFFDSNLLRNSVPQQPLDESGVGMSTLSRFRGSRPPSDRYTLLAACRDDQFCREMWDSETAKHFGIFSFFLLRALREALGQPQSWRDLKEALACEIALVNPDQEVQLEGAVDRQIFDSINLRPEPFLPIEAVNGKEVLLAGGTVHGVVQDSIWHCFPSGTRQADSPPIASVRIHSVSFVQSKGRIEPGTVSQDSRLSHSPARGRAFEHSRPSDRRLRVARPECWTDRQSVLEILEESPLLSWTDSPNTADVTVLELPPRDKPTREALIPTLGPLHEPHWAVLDSVHGGQLAPARPTQGGSASAARELRSDLECLARQRILRDLEHPAPDRISGCEGGARPSSVGARRRLGEGPPRRPILQSVISWLSALSADRDSRWMIRFTSP